MKSKGDAGYSPTVVVTTGFPSPHAETHNQGGTDPVQIGMVQVTGLTAALAGYQPLDSDLTAYAGAANAAARATLIGLGAANNVTFSTVTASITLLVGSALSAGEVAFFHDSGANFDTLSPASGASDRTFTLPSTSGTLALTSEVATRAALATVQTATPTTGQTVAMTDSTTDNTLYLTPAGTLAALTVNLPSEANSRIGQVIRIFTRQILTSLTIANATNIYGAPTTLVANGSVTLQKMAANTWGTVV